ncbi:MAG: DNA polymerase, partial [Candidatus Gracilibacteria bacterium]|nr:DNA polymerase [Candidatus Gracilibacteria bacterium]
MCLEEYSTQNFDIEIETEELLSQKGEFLLNQVSKKNISNYSTSLLFIIEKLKKSQKIDENDKKILIEIDFPFMEVLSKVEQNGVKVDVEKLSEIGEYLKKEILIEEEKIFSLSGENFNIASPKQVGIILFEKLGLPSGKKTKTGYSVDLEVLEGLSFKYPIAKHILNHRQYSKLLSTYVEGLQKLIDKKTKKIHTSYNQTVTSTGRLSSTNPNLQNIPSSSSGVSSLIRKAFVPYDENEDIIVAFDYSQIEVRLLAIMSGDENLINAFKNNLDIHQNTGKFIFGKDELLPEERKIAKAVNFGVIYGISPFGLSKMIGISQAESKIYIEKFYETYPKVKDFFDEIIKNCEKKGYVQTMFL